MACQRSNNNSEAEPTTNFRFFETGFPYPGFTADLSVSSGKIDGLEGGLFGIIKAS